MWYLSSSHLKALTQTAAATAIRSQSFAFPCPKVAIFWGHDASLARLAARSLCWETLEASSCFQSSVQPSFALATTVFPSFTQTIASAIPPLREELQDLVSSSPDTCDKPASYGSVTPLVEPSWPHSHWQGLWLCRASHQLHPWLTKSSAWPEQTLQPWHWRFAESLRWVRRAFFARHTRQTLDSWPASPQWQLFVARRAQPPKEQEWQGCLTQP